MPRPVPDRIVILCWGDDRIDWWRGAAPDEAILTSAVETMADNSIQPEEADAWSFMVRWTTSAAIDQVQLEHQDGIPAFDRDLNEADEEDRAMSEREDRLTQLLQARFLPAAAEKIGDLTKLLRECRLTLLAHGAMASVKAIDDMIGELEGAG